MRPAAVDILKRGDRELKEITKQFGETAEGFDKAAKARSAGLDEPAPFMERASAQRRPAQEKTLDRVFELRGVLTQDEWSRVLATFKSRLGRRERGDGGARRSRHGDRR